MFSGLLLASSFITTAATADTLSIAVASNFQTTLAEIADQFEAKTGHKIKVIPGSTGKHFAQISHGAPFDLFFAADARRPELLEKKQLIVAGSRFTYAVGKLVLWSPSADYKLENGQVLDGQDFQYLAIANPKLAPYGKAAWQYLQKTHRAQKLRSQMVRGENIGQTYQFVKSGNAQLGLVALSQVISQMILNNTMSANYWPIPEQDYSPIKQQAVLLKDSPLAQDFLTWFKSAPARQIIHRYGYSTE
ncbi:molybdate ABC transporter substrate-binding protein [Pelagibaculum spongiae]|uniref:Molybdate ABC transporter substrate-binding protein n=1 Tax=Pelagibaculum spongiae TaxID=2080658 RepID=A0A2V1GR54_9GAMM|nr:molybdate ABC transporter substrate-binding protein [Pelagibaculum spongiae]PVZ63460.1 molybdate ABC transporter substrate-binding protein [Pelagibaculum spongiae]